MFTNRLSGRALQGGLLAAILVIFALRVSEVSPAESAKPQAAIGQPAAPAKNATHGIAQRTPWTTSRLTGSPEPPHPYKIERVFPKLTFKNPLLLTMAP